jgi:hypothetical protein
MREPGSRTCCRALLILLHNLRPEQQVHAAQFLLREIDQLYASAGCTPPRWIGELRHEFATLQAGAASPKGEV